MLTPGVDPRGAVVRRGPRPRRRATADHRPRRVAAVALSGTERGGPRSPRSYDRRGVPRRSLRCAAEGPTRRGGGRGAATPGGDGGGGDGAVRRCGLRGGHPATRGRRGLGPRPGDRKSVV